MIARIVAASLLTWSSQGLAANTCPATLAPALFPVLATSDWTGDADVDRIMVARRARTAACSGDAECVISAMRWTAEEKAGLIARASAGRSGEVSEQDTAIEALGREIEGLNGVLAVYAGDRAPLYPAIDGPDDAIGSAARRAKVSRAVRMSRGCARGAILQASGAGLAAALLTVNGRTDAVELAPVDRRYNSSAARAARTIDWSKYRYTALVVLGIGPEDRSIRLSAGSDANARLAAERFREGLAPFIVVSGAAVHPRRTRFVEALEMRRALTGRYGVPPERIIIDPYARHTTTNLRNVARRLAVAGIPLDRKYLILTNPEQSRYVSSSEFTERNDRELGYQPGTVGERLSPTDLAYTPSIKSLRIDPADPLDP